MCNRQGIVLNILSWNNCACGDIYAYLLTKLFVSKL